MDAPTVRARLQPFLQSRKDVVAAYLFGSVARGTATTTSDIDIGIVLASGKPKDLDGIAAVTRLHGEIEGVLRHEVDLVVLNGASPDLLHRVLRDGVLLHESSHTRRIEFEVRARNDYFDLLPILDRYRRTVLGKL